MAKRAVDEQFQNVHGGPRIARAPLPVQHQRPRLAYLSLLATVRGCLARAEERGLGDDDFSSLIRLLDG